MTPVHFASEIHHIGLWLTVRHVIVLLSILAAAVNITGIVPQLLTMLRQRSSRGQSPLGWSLSGTCSLSLLFVNAVGYHALVLACGNLLSASGCLTAVFLARRYRSETVACEEVLQVLADAPEQVLSELASPELHALTETVLEEQHRRTGEAIPETVVAELGADDLHALTDTVLEEHRRRTGEPVPADAIAEMHTTEFEALADTVFKEQSRRAGRLALALDAA